MDRKIVITGATGLIGRKLCKLLIDNGDKITIFSRSADKAKKLITGAQNYVEWDYNSTNLAGYLEDQYAVIHLAGENVMAKRWNEKHKKNIFNSRINTTKALVDAIKMTADKPKVLIAASAIGYYGNSEQPVTEESNAGNDFLAGVVKAWEEETKKVDLLKIRRVNVRIGIVLDKNEGAFAQMITPYKFFVGGPLGSGKQWISWIHIEDLVNIFLFALDNGNVEGAVNSVSPNPITMNQFAKAIGKTLKRPSFLRMPEFLLRLILGGSSSVVTGGSKVSSLKIISCGFKFKYTYIEEALNNLL